MAIDQLRWTLISPEHGRPVLPSALVCEDCLKIGTPWLIPKLNSPWRFPGSTTPKLPY
jgi:hypothetical protein